MGKDGSRQVKIGLFPVLKIDLKTLDQMRNVL